MQVLPVEPILDKLLSTDQVRLEEFDKMKQMNGDVERARYLLSEILPYSCTKDFHKFCDTLLEAGGYDQILHLIQPDRHPGYQNNKFIILNVDNISIYCMQIYRTEIPEVQNLF